MATVLLLELMLGALGLPQAVQSQSPSRDLQWTRIDKPGATGNVVVPGSDVSEIAIGSSICYALDTNPPGRIYRSMSGGLRWEDISPFLLAAGAALPATKIAVAPDEPAIIAVATNGGTNFYLSVDGGITWGNMHMGVPIGTIESIAISKSYGERNEQRDILVGTALFGDNLSSGQVLLLHLGSVVPYWRNLNIRVDPALIGGDVSAVAFSPSYTDDRTIVAVASTGADVALPAAKRNRTFLCIGTNLDVVTGNIDWSADPNWPIEIPPGSSVGDSAAATLIAGGLALPGNFSATGGPGKSTLVYAFYRVDSVPLPVTGPSDAYRIDVSMPPTPVIAFAPGAGSRRYSSIALSGNKLLAGETVPQPGDPPLTIGVRISLNASTTTPAFTISGNPYGQSNAKVAWSGSVAYCGTGGAESGFSISNDNGAHWSQVGLIDTTVILQDVVAASSPQSIFIASTSTTNIESVWRSAGEPLGQYWGRVLAINAVSNKIIVRLSPQYRDDYTVYVCEVGWSGPVPNYSQFWVSHDRGNAWKQYYPPLGIIDLAVAEKKVCYVALPGGRVSKSDNSGQFWKNAEPTWLPEITMLSLAGADTVLVGGRHGDVAYSSDGGMSYTLIAENLRNDAPVQVVADARYQENSFIYAGCRNIIYRWVINQSQRWDIIRRTAAGRQISGMASVKGIIYGLWHTAAGGSGAERSLDPAVSLTSLEWDTLQAGATTARFDITPTALKYSISDTTVILWTIDTAPAAPQDNTVMVYFDCLAWNRPNLTLSNNAVIGCDPAAGRNQEVNFTWDDICADNRYQLQIAKDDKFTLRVFDSSDAFPFLLPPDITSPSLVYFAGGGGTFPALAGIPVPELECGHGYYWRVRARAAVTGDVIRSPWSESRAFTIKAGFRVTTPYYGPQLLAPDNGCGCPCNAPAAFSWTPFKETTDYRFELSTNPDMSRPLVSTTVKATAYQYRGQLKCDTTYFWRVMAVQPAPSEWSAVFSFKVHPTEPTATTTLAATAPVTQTPLWVWLVIGLGGMLVVIIIILMLSLKREEEVEE